MLAQSDINSNDTLYQSIADDRDFDTASMYCTEEFGSSNNRGYLMEILNQQQQEVLVNLISTDNTFLDEYYWIGLQYNDSKYVWTSGGEASYREYITNLTDTDSYCVAVDKEGKWLGLDCSGDYSYICQRRK